MSAAGVDRKWVAQCWKAIDQNTPFAFSDLEKLGASGTPSEETAKILHCVETIWLHMTPEHSDQQIAKIFENCPAVRTVILFTNRKIADVVLSSLGQLRLTALTINGFNVATVDFPDEALNRLVTLSAQQALSFSAGLSEEKQVNKLSAAPPFSLLRTLEIHRSPSFTGVALTQVPNLTSLGLQRCSLIDEGMEQIGKLSFLKKLSLFQHHQVSERGLYSLLDLTQLEELFLNDLPVSDAVLISISEKLYHINTFSLDSPTAEVTDKGCRAMMNLPVLQNLFLWNCKQITGRGIQNDRFLALKKLRLDNCAITDEGCEALSKHTMTDLQLSQLSLITDRGLSSLAQLPLIFLDVRGCPQITEAAFIQLKKTLPRSIKATFSKE